MCQYCTEKVAIKDSSQILCKQKKNLLIQKYMKKTLLICLLTVLGLSLVSAQDENTFVPSHEINLGWGTLPIIPAVYLGFENNGCYEPNDLLGDGYLDALYTEGATRTTAAITASYMYNLTKRFSVGGSLSYYGVYRSTFDRVTEELVGRHTDQCLSAIAMVKLNYLSTEIVRLYGKLGLGLGLNWTNHYLEDEGYSDRHMYLTGNVTFLGVQVGKKLYGFGEFGVGSNGVLIGGIGYKL